MKSLKNQFVLCIGVISVIALFLRFYDLPNTPPGYTWDEAAITYNAWSIKEWRRDENAIRLPLSFKSFGDYKPPAFIYLMAGVFTLAPLDPFYTRFVAALFGMGTVVVAGLLGYSLSSVIMLQQEFRKWFGLLTYAIVALSPWSVHLSRIGFEQNMTLFLLTLGLWLITLEPRRPILFLVALISWAGALYSFHTAKVIVPLLLVWWVFFYGREWLSKNAKAVISAGLLFLLLCLPLVWDSLYGRALARAENLILFPDDGLAMPWLVVGLKFFFNLLDHLSPQFWLLSGAFWPGMEEMVNPRNSVLGSSLVYPIGYYLLLIAVVVLLIKKRRIFALWGSLFFIGLMPALVSNDSPHALRSSWTIVPAALLISYGVTSIVRLFKAKRITLIGVGILITLYTLSIVRFSAYYFGPQYEAQVAYDFQFGYKELFDYLGTIDTQDTRIVISDYYGQPYMYALVYNKIHPQDYQFGALNRYQFRSFVSAKDMESNIIYAASPTQINPSDPRVIHVIKAPKSETIVWVITRT